MTDRFGKIEVRLPAGLARIGVTSRTLALGGAAVLALVVATAAVGLTAGDDPTRAKPAAQETVDDSYDTPVGDLLEQGDLPLPSLAGDQGSTGVPPNTSPRPTVASPPADAGQIATYRGGAGTLTPAGIATLAMAAGCSSADAVTATAVAIAESGGSPSAQGDTTLMDATWDWSAGLWQIRGLKSQRNTGELRDSVANHDAATNAKAMYAISGGCHDWGPWTTYTRGTYESFLSIARQAVDHVDSYKRAHGGQLPPVAAPDPNAPIPAGSGGGAADPANPAGAGARTTGSAAPRRSTPATSGAGTRSGGGTTGDGAPAPATTSAPGGRPATSAPKATAVPTKLPTLLPTKLPTVLPTKLPTKLPTVLPTKLPTLLPTKLPGLP